MFEAFVIFATEMCMGSSQYDGCVKWMLQCQVNDVVVTKPWTASDGAERCVENLPPWATEGM